MPWHGVGADVGDVDLAFSVSRDSSSGSLALLVACLPLINQSLDPPSLRSSA